MLHASLVRTNVAYVPSSSACFYGRVLTRKTHLCYRPTMDDDPHIPGDVSNERKVGSSKERDGMVMLYRRGAHGRNVVRFHAFRISVERVRSSLRTSIAALIALQGGAPYDHSHCNSSIAATASVTRCGLFVSFACHHPP